jgi:hypothetical protein
MGMQFKMVKLFHDNKNQAHNADLQALKQNMLFILQQHLKTNRLLGKMP